MIENGGGDPRSALLAQLKDIFETDPEAFISRTTNLNHADVAMIGTLIQVYCYAVSMLDASLTYCATPRRTRQGVPRDCKTRRSSQH